MSADESTAMKLLTCVGQAQSSVMETVAASRQREWRRAADLMTSSETACRATRKIQTALIGQDEGCGKITINLILVRAQNRLMTAMLCRDLAKEIIALRQERST